MRPLFDALYDTMDPEKLSAYMERGTIEVAPLAFMRGHTLNDSFVILDEAQNTTPEQMQMFLTRLGFGSKMVVTGDVTQIDLPREQAVSSRCSRSSARSTASGSSASRTRTSCGTTRAADRRGLQAARERPAPSASADGLREVDNERADVDETEPCGSRMRVRARVDGDGAALRRAGRDPRAEA